MTHTVQRPFFCRKDQFISEGYPGQVLCVGIEVNALQTNPIYKFRIGKNPEVYEGDSVIALQIADFWTNKKGRKVAIVPVEFFKKQYI